MQRRFKKIQSFNVHLFIKQNKIASAFVGASMALIILLYLIRGFSIWSYNRQILGALEQPQRLTVAEAQNNTHINSIKPFVEVPEDTVTVGSIQNVNVLKKHHNFFQKSKKGDVVMLYPEFTVIYDPINKTIIDISKQGVLKKL